MHRYIWTKGDCDHHSNYDGGGDDENYCDKRLQPHKYVQEKVHRTATTPMGQAQ